VRLTAAEAEDMHLKALLATLQEVCRLGQSPVFTVDGMQELPTMPRKAPAQVSRKQRAYVGGEQFRALEFVVETISPVTDDLRVSVVLGPAQMSLAKEIMNVRLPLDEAVQKFAGLDAWIASVQPALKPPEPVGVPNVPVVSTEELRGSEGWGAW